MSSRLRTAADQAAEFRALHRQLRPLVLANAWDAGSSRVIEMSGAHAVATTSAGLAWSHGYPDGGIIPSGVLVGAVREIARVISVPLTVDIENGYAQGPGAVGETVAAVIDAGAVGINIEDGTDPPSVLAEKIAAARHEAQVAGVDLFINARTDVYLRALASPDEAIGETVVRAQRYRDAGADGIFVPGIADSAAIGQLAAAIDLPLNVMIVPGLPPLSDLAQLGVKRVSAGSTIAIVALTLIRTAASKLLRDETYGTLTEPGMTYPELNNLFAVS